MKPQIRTIIQARMNSSRLPGKALLPLAGIPSCVLAALRAARDGGDVVLATSDQQTDDPIVWAAESHGVASVRGSRDDVLGRFVDAARGLPDEAVIVRLTADNPVPDAGFVSALVEAFVGSEADIVGPRWPDDGLPYGLMAEVTYAGVLRQAASRTESAFDREHVTPWIWRNRTGKGVPGLRDETRGAHLRCTIDSFDDFIRMARLFHEQPDPVGVPWRVLVRELASAADAPVGLLPMKRSSQGLHGALVLGTAQLGMDYGTVVQVAPPSDSEAGAIVRTAIAHGVTHIDTARVYGQSERRVGRALSEGWQGRASVVTKLDPLADIPAEAPPWAVEAAVRASVFRSCCALGVERLDTLLLHRASHRNSWGGAVWRTVRGLKDEGLVARLGVSAQSVEEAAEASEDPAVEHIQFPCNILDWRWEEAGVIERLRRRPDLLVHIRSVFLQGILLRASPERWPSIEGVDPANVAAWLQETAERLGRESVADLCIAYMRAKDWVDGLVIGIERLEQLRENIRLFQTPPLTDGEVSEVEASRPRLPERLFNPAQW